MANKTRSRHGEIKPQVRDGMLYLKFTYAPKKRKELHLRLRDTKNNRNVARAIGSQIEADLAWGRFDIEKVNHYIPGYQDPKPEPTPTITTAELFAEFIEWKRSQIDVATIASKYSPVLSKLKQYGDISDQSAADSFWAGMCEKLKARTANAYLQILKSFEEWAGDRHPQVFGPLLRLRDKEPREKRKPFTAEEIKLILAAFETSRYYKYYYNFTLFLFSLGLRPSELIGLQWKHIDLEARTVAIYESLSRGEGGNGAGWARQRKRRKTGTLTVLPLSDRLMGVLESMDCDRHPEDLVFPSPRNGKAIDDHSFSQRAWKTTLAEAGVEHRPPYCCRHSFLSHAIDQGATLPEAAYLAGHSSLDMVQRTYGHKVKRPTMPDLGI